MHYPKVSLCVLTYNHERYIRETIEGVLCQDYPNLEIIISDDNSTDNTWQLIQEFTKDYSGNHTVILNRNEYNLGLVGNVNKVVYELSCGQYVMLSGGDDVCLPRLISDAVDCIDSKGCCAVSFNAYIIDRDSRQTGMMDVDSGREVDIFYLEDYLKGSYKSNGACRIIKRDVYDAFGPYGDCQTEDTTNMLRCFLYGSVAYSYSMNLKYRIHDSNISSFDSLMTRFNPDLIADQYIRDVNRSYELNMITERSRAELIEAIDHYRIIEKAKRDVYKQSNIFSKMLCVLKYIRNPHLRFSDILSLTVFSSLFRRLKRFILCKRWA